MEEQRISKIEREKREKKKKKNLIKKENFETFKKKFFPPFCVKEV